MWGTLCGKGGWLMAVRERTEEIERITLSPFATLSENSRGRCRTILKRHTVIHGTYQPSIPEGCRYRGLLYFTAFQCGRCSISCRSIRFDIANQTTYTVRGCTMGKDLHIFGNAILILGNITS